MKDEKGKILRRKALYSLNGLKSMILILMIVMIKLLNTIIIQIKKFFFVKVENKEEKNIDVKIKRTKKEREIKTHRTLGMYWLC